MTFIVRVSQRVIIKTDISRLDGDLSSGLFETLLTIVMAAVTVTEPMMRLCSCRNCIPCNIPSFNTKVWVRSQEILYQVSGYLGMAYMDKYTGEV